MFYAFNKIFIFLIGLALAKGNGDNVQCLDSIPTTVKIDTLIRFSEAWNNHDIDSLMSFMSGSDNDGGSDCIFETASGSEQYGNRFVGLEDVRKAFSNAWILVSDAQWENAQHFISSDGSSGYSTWTFTGTASDGSKIEQDGVDIFQFNTTSGKILSKKAFKKLRL